MKNVRSSKGYGMNSPFANEPVNRIEGDGKISMRNTRRKLVAVDDRQAVMLRPGGEYQMQGNVTEIPPEMLMELEPKLVEKHLTTLKKAQQMEFVEKYTPLDESMKRAALMQMFQKYHNEILSQGGQYQNGGLLPDTDPYLRNMLQDTPPSTLQVAQRPLQNQNYNAMFLDFAGPASEEARMLGRQGNFDQATQVRQDIMTANRFRQEQEASYLPPVGPERFQDGGATEWNYVAPPMEGFQYESIKSNRLTKENTVDIAAHPQGKSQGKPQGNGSGVVGRSPVVRRPTPVVQDQSTPEEEAFWAKQREQRAAEAKNPRRDTGTLQDYIPVYDVPPPVSNTTMAVAAVTGDPIYRLTTPPANGRRSQAPVENPNDYISIWKQGANFGYPNKALLDTDKTELVKTFANGDTLLTYNVFSPLDSKKLIPMYMVRDARSGKYAQLDPTNTSQLQALKVAR